MKSYRVKIRLSARPLRVVHRAVTTNNLDAIAWQFWIVWPSALAIELKEI